MLWDICLDHLSRGGGSQQVRGEPDAPAHDMLLWESSFLGLEPGAPPFQNLQVITPTGDSRMPGPLTFRWGGET